MPSETFVLRSNRSILLLTKQNFQDLYTAGVYRRRHHHVFRLWAWQQVESTPSLVTVTC